MTAKEQLAMACPTVSVGILTADLLNLGSELRVLERSGVPLVHIDVMDGVFCPQMTVGPAFIKALKTPLLKDVHLMIVDPIDKLESFVAAGADIVTVHAETPHVHRALQVLGKMTNANDPARGIVRGLGLNPSTPLSAVEPLVDELDMVALLAVNPGFAGQSFIDATAKRMAQLIEMFNRLGRDVLACVDGGIKKDNIKAAAAMGADLVVTGSAVFDGKSAAANAAFMLEAVRS